MNAAYNVPTDGEVAKAKQHGFILLDPIESYEYAMNGYYTKVRVWVKPDSTGFSTRNLVCRSTGFKEGIEFEVKFG